MVYKVNTSLAIPGADLDIRKMPAHWLLARMGKTVLRPGGLQLTRQLLEVLNIRSSDDVAEFAPGLGHTAKLILDYEPNSYIGIERDLAAKLWTHRHLPPRSNTSLVLGSAENTGLATGSRTVIVGEAMMSMNPHAKKQQIIEEAFRLLEPGGRFGMHELCLASDDLTNDHRQQIESDLSHALNVGARPLSKTEWLGFLTSAGFEIKHYVTAPMDLLRPARVIEDEGWIGSLRIGKNLLLNSPARKRIAAIAHTLKHHRTALSAVCIVAEKRGGKSERDASMVGLLTHSGIRW
jgi:SAM-dependent methyltransferase